MSQQVATVQKLSPGLDDRQKHAALAIASGELDTFTDRVQDALNEIAGMKSDYLEALGGKDRDAAHRALMSIAACIDRVNDYAAVARFKANRGS